MKKGKLIVFEGIDGSGKHTQASLLVRCLRKKGIKVFTDHFPKYETFTGSYVGRMLRGEFGELDNLDPHVVAPLYALDRFAAKRSILKKLDEGRWCVLDRYVHSNCHQAAKAKNKKEMLEIINYFEELEFKILGVPQEDVVIYLSIDGRSAQNLIDKKNVRKYLGAKARDIAESNINHQLAAARVYDFMARNRKNWIKINCMAKDNSILSVDRIQEKVWKRVLKLL